ncbi:protein of unknown function [Agreia sp. COWG]|nr:protein of unknown function [Agreia sp. COWG]
MLTERTYPTITDGVYEAAGRIAADAPTRWVCDRSHRATIGQFPHKLAEITIRYRPSQETTTLAAAERS